MPDDRVPTHWHVVDMLHAAVPSEATVFVPSDQYFEEWLKNQPADEGGDSLPLRPDEGRGIAQLLGQMHKEGTEFVFENKHSNGRTLRHHVTCPRFSAISESDIANNRSASAVAELRVALDGGTPTLLKVKLRWVNRGADCWLNVQGNPTSLLAGTNAFVAATGLAADQERLYLLRFPFLFLGRVLRAVDPAFRWSDATAARLKSGEFSLHNVQLAMYLPFADDGELRRFLRWLRAVYCTPIVDEKWSSFLLGACIGLRVEAISDARGDPNGVMFRAYRNAAGNADLTVNFYNKLAALGEAGTALLGRPQRDWLAKHLRVDITLHPPGDRPLVHHRWLAAYPSHRHRVVPRPGGIPRRRGRLPRLVAARGAGDQAEIAGGGRLPPRPPRSGTGQAVRSPAAHGGVGALGRRPR